MASIEFLGRVRTPYVHPVRTPAWKEQTVQEVVENFFFDESIYNSLFYWGKNSRVVM